MTEITQADRDAALNCICLTEERTQIVAEAFARHRMEERAAIVAWLRQQGITEDEYESKNGWWWTPTGAQYGASILEAIEAGEHLK